MTVKYKMTHFAKQKKKIQEETEKHDESNNKKSGLAQCYPNYISREEANNGLRTGHFIKGILRINPNFTKQSYVTTENSSGPCYVISSFIDRNRALDGDEVILQMEENNSENQKGPQVVFISKKVQSRLAVGFLTPVENNTNFALFSPRDKRVPKMSIHKSQWPKNFDLHPEHFKDVLCVAQIWKWIKIKRAQGNIIEVLGVSGNLKCENLAILKEFCLTAYCGIGLSSHFLPDLPREDLRMKCVFTIDNSGTRDMDDALSWHELPNGNYEIGVHISDVSHYLKEGTALDETVKTKATSVYLVNASYNMLPDDLCSLCSLEPNKERLTFSIFYETTRDGIVLRKRGAKSVINSCAELTYTHAQMLLDAPNTIFDRNSLPPIYHGFTPQDLSKAVNALQKVALQCKEERRRKYGLRKQSPSVTFRLDQVTGEPIELVKQAYIASQQLVEELMLLTNVTVAERVYHYFPQLTLLRVHEPPNIAKITRLKKNLQSLGIHIEVSSSKKIQESIDKYNIDDAFAVVLNRLVGKCMHKKKYICSGTSKNASFEHFSLGFPIYTHFTSPIRRYADIVTHRLLATSLQYRKHFRLKVPEISDIANICNGQELRAEKAADASFDLYLAHFVESHQPFIEEAVVYNVKKDCFDVVVFRTGRSLRVYANTFDETWEWKSDKVVVEGNAKAMWKMSIGFPETSLVVDVFSVVKVKLTKATRSNRLKANLCRP
ncbi:DIS3-like exonuclease 2 [Zophobas morio]